MAEILTTETKNATVLTPEGKVSPTWDEANYSWDDAIGTWDVPGTPLAAESKNVSTLTNENKNA